MAKDTNNLKALEAKINERADQVLGSNTASDAVGSASDIRRLEYEKAKDLGMFDDAPTQDFYQDPGTFFGRGTQFSGVEMNKYSRGLLQGMDPVDYMANNQSIGEQIMFGTGRLVGTTATKLLEGLGYAAGSIPALLFWDSNLMLDNGFSALFRSAGEGLKEAMPIMHTQKYMQGNILEQMGTLSFWMDDVVDGAAFMMSNIIGAKGVGMIGQAAGGYGKMAKVFSNYARAIKTGKAVKGAMNLKKWTDGLDLATMSLYNSITEAAFEAKDIKDSLRNQGLSNEEASKAAMNTFWTNVGVLMGPNMITNSMIFKPFKPTKGAASKLFKDGKLVKENLKALGKGDIAGAFAKNAAISMGSEGLWEENIQLAIQNYETGRALGEDDRSRLEALAEEWVNNFTTDEGQKAMVLGAIIGLIPGGAGGAKQAKGTRAELQFLHGAMQSTLDRYQSSLDNLLVKDEKGEVEIDSKTGKPILNMPVIKEAWEAHLQSMSNMGNSMVALEAGNETFYNFLMEQRLASMAAGFMAHPDGNELFKAQLDVLMEKELELLEKTGNEELGDQVRSLKSDYEQKADVYQDLYTAIVNNYTAFSDYGTSQEATDYKNSVVNRLFMESANQNFWQEQKQKVEGEISKIAGSKMAGTKLGNTETKRFEKQLAGINEILQKSERTFRELASRKTQNAEWERIKPDAKEVEPTEVAVKDSDGNMSLYLGKEGDEHTFVKDEEGNIEKLSDRDVKLRGMRDEAGNLIVEPDVVLDEEGNEYTLEGKEGDHYVIKDVVTGETGLATEREVKTLKFKDTDLGTVEQEVLQRDKRRVALLAEKYEAIKDKLSTKAGKASKLDLDKELVAQLGTHKYDNHTFRDMFGKNDITGAIPVIFRGIMGDLSMSPNLKKIVFTPYDGGKETRFMPDSKRTLSQNGIFVYSNYTFDMELGRDGSSFIVNGTLLHNFHNNPLNAIYKDEQGNPIGIRLWKGNKFVYIKNPVIVADLAVAIPMLEVARAEALDHMKESRESFVWVKDPGSKRGREYQVYLKNGEYVVADYDTGNRYGEKLSARVIDAFFESLGGRLDRFANLVQNSASKTEIQNELREFDNIIRQATPEEIDGAKSAAEVQGTDPDVEEAGRLPDEPESPEVEEDLKLDQPKEVVKEIQRINKERKSKLAQIVRNEEKGPINAKYDAQIEALKEKVDDSAKKETEVEEGEKVEETIIDAKAKEAAELETDAQLNQEEQEAQEGPLEADTAIEPLNDNEIPLRHKESKKRDEIEGVDPANTIAYNYKKMPVFTAWISKLINRVNMHEAHFSIDYDSDDFVRGFWANNAELKEKLEGKVLTQKEVDEYLAMEDYKKTTNSVDRIPIKVTLMDKDGNIVEGETLHLHTTSFKTEDARARTGKEMGDVRIVRRKILEGILKDTNPHISNISKTKGKPNNRVPEEGKDRNSLITSVFKAKAEDVRIGIGKDNGAIRRADGTDMPGTGNEGNVFMEIDETCNGESTTIKLNVTKIGEEHAKILLSALLQSQAKQHGNLYEGEGVSGLTIKEVIDMLALEGKDLTEQAGKDSPKPYLIDKQLWVDAGGVYFGDKSIPVVGSTPEQKREFVDWAMRHKNYNIPLKKLKNVFERDATLGSFTAKEGETYETFVVRNGLVKTDLVAEMPFIAPTIIFDNSTLIDNKVVTEGQEELGTEQKTVAKKGNVVRQRITRKFKKASQFADLPIGTILFNESKKITKEAEKEHEQDEIEDVRTDWFEIVENKEGQKVLRTIEVTKDTIPFNDVTLDNTKKLEELLLNYKYVDPLKAVFEKTVVVKEKAPKKEEPKKPVVEELMKRPTLKTVKVELEGLSMDELKNVAKQLRQKAVTARENERLGKTVLGGSASIQEDYNAVKRYIAGLSIAEKVGDPIVRSTTASNRFDLLRVKPTGLVNYDLIDARKATQWLRDKLPAGEIQWLDDLLEVGDVVAFGQFRRDLITLSKQAEAGTEYHEAYHRISFGFLTDTTRKMLYAEARKKYGLEGKTDLVVEEFLAEKFREYVIVEDKASWLKKAGRRMKTLFRRLLDWLHITNRKDPKDIESVFRAINEGHFRRATLLADNEYVKSPKAFLADVKGYSSKEIGEIVKGMTHVALKINGVERMMDVPKIDFEVVREEFYDFYDDLIDDNKPELAERYMSVLDNFDEWVELCESYLRSFKIGKSTKEIVAGENTAEDGIDALDEQADDATSDFAKLDKASYESNFKDNVLSSIKMLIMMLPESSDVNTHLELPAFVDFNATWNKLMSDLHNEDNITDMLAIIDTNSENDLPYTKLSERLKAGNEELRTQFEVSVKRAKHKFVDLLFEMQGGKPIFQFQDTDTQRATKKFVLEWSNSFYNSDFFKQDQIVKSKVEAVNAEYKELLSRVRTEYNKSGKLKDYGIAVLDTVKLLNTISIPVDTDVLTDIIKGKEAANDHKGLKLFLLDDLEFLFGKKGVMFRRTARTQVESESGRKLADSELFTDEKAVENIAKAYIRTKPEELSVTVLGPASNPYFVYAPNNYVTDTIRRFKKSNKHINDILGTANGKNSYILKQLLDSKTVKGFDIKTFSGFIQKDVGDVGRDYLGLNEAEDFLFKLSAIHKGFQYKSPKSGYLPMPTLADRKTYYLYDGIDILNYEMVPNAQGNLVAAPNSQAIEVFKKYAEDEANRITLVKKQIKEALKTKDSSELYEGMHYIIKNDADAAPLIAGNLAKFEKVDKDIVKIFVDNKGNYMGNGAHHQHFRGFDKAAQNPYKYIENGIDFIKDNTIRYAAELGIIKIREKDGKPVIIDNVLLDANLITTVAKEFNDDRLQAIERILANYAVNTMMSVIETEKMLSGDVASFKGTTTKEINEDKIKRSTVLTSTGDNLRTTFPPEHELHGQTDYNVITLNTSTLRSAYHDGLVEKHTAIIKAEAEKRNKPISDAKAKAMAEYRLENYTAVDQTDAQVYLSPTMYRSLLIRLGEWNDLKQEAFDILQSDKIPSLEEERSAMNLLMPPLKFVYYGLTIKNGLSVPVFDKMSMAPLFKRFVKDTNLQDLYDRMEQQGQYKDSKEKIHMVKFDTVTKVGNQERVNYYADKNPTTVRNLGPGKLAIQPQSFDNLRRQLLTDPHDVEKSLFGTQIKKLGMSNISFDGTYTVGNDPMSGKELTDQWTQMLKDFSNMGKARVLKRLGITQEHENAPYRISDPKKLMKMLREDAIASGMTDNIVDALKVDANGELEMTIDALPERKWIYSRLISLVSKETVDLKLPGNAFIQMTNFGLDKMTDAEADAKRLNISWLDENDNKRSRPLNFYDVSKDGGVTPMECHVSINLFKRVIPDYENKTWEQKKAWVKEHPEILGWRIPTQGLNSVAHLKVVGLLPEQLGDTIILPAEFTALTGADFDIDKLFVARYNYDKNGKEVKYTIGGKNSRAAMENRLLDMYKAVLISPHHYAQVTTPLDSHTELIKSVYRKVIDLNGESAEVSEAMWELSPRYQAEVKKKYTGGKSGIGPFALNNAHHPLGQIAGLAIKSRDGVNGNIGVGNTTVIDGETVTSLAKIEDQDGVQILDWMSALINAHVDVAKDPYILSLNINQKTYGMTNLLIRAGAGELTFWFMPQPVLVDLAKEAATQRGNIKLTNKYPMSIIRARYEMLRDRALELEGEKFTTKDRSATLGEEGAAVIKEVWNKERLAHDIDKNTPRDSAFYIRQLEILDTYKDLDVSATALADVVSSSQIDTKKYGSNLSEIVGFMNRYKRMWDVDALHNTDKLFKDTFLETLYNNSVLLSKELFGQLTITGTKPFQDALTRIMQITGNGYTTDKKYINFVSDELFASISSSFFEKEMGATPAKVEKLFYGENGVVAQVSKIKTGKLYPDLQDNRLLTLLKTELGLEVDEDNFNKLTLHSTNIKEKWDRDELVRSWNELLEYEHSDKATQDGVRNLGKNIIMYAFYSSGFNKTLTSFYEFIPNKWLKDAGYSAYMLKVLDSLKENMQLSIINDAIDDIFVNNWAKTKITPTYRTKPLVPEVVEGIKHVFKGEKGHVTMFQLEYDDKSDRYMGTNEDKDPVYSPYVLRSGSLFKYIGYDRTSLNAIYKLVPIKKGYNNKGFVIKEYYPGKSIIPSNNSKVSEEAMAFTDRVLAKVSVNAKNDNYRNIKFMSIYDVDLKNDKNDRKSAEEKEEVTLENKVFKTFEDFLVTFLGNPSYVNNLDIKLNTAERKAARQNLLDNDVSTLQAQDLLLYLQQAYDAGRLPLMPISAGGASVRTPGTIQKVEVKPEISDEVLMQQARYKKFLEESPFKSDAEIREQDTPDVIFSTEPFEVWKILDKYGKSFDDLTSGAQQELRDKYKHCK